MPYFDRLSGLKRWAAGGGVSEPSDAQANQGFAYLANGKPTVEGFNALFQGNDDAHNWLFKGFRGILTRAGMAPVENDEFQIANALRVLATRPWWYENTAGSKTYIVPAGATVLFVLVVGGGGGSTGCDNGNFRAGAGGGGGGAALGLVNVASGATISATVGAAGGGAAVAGTSGVAGGTTSFGSLMSASGGGGGGTVAAEPTAGGFGGYATGGLVNLQGTPGGPGNGNTTPVGTGYGGGSALLGGGGMAGLGISAAHTAATPGSGAPAPYGGVSGGSFRAGIAGRPGCILVVPVA
jgi:hypothetical protein